MANITGTTTSEKVDRIISFLSLLLHFTGTGKRSEGDKEPKDHLKTSIIDMLSRKDESAFMEAMAVLGKKDPDGELKNRILGWMEALKNNTTTWKYTYLFRIFITTNPDKDARVNILESYAKEKDDAARTRRFEQEKTPNWMVEAMGKKVKAVMEYMTSEGMPGVQSGMNNLTQRMRQEIAHRRTNRGQQ